nr:hypothetical protein [Escherichia coli]
MALRNTANGMAEMQRSSIFF